MTKKFSELREFTDAQMAKLKKEYEPLKGKSISMANINKMNSMLNTYSVDMLMKLAKGDVPFLSTSAKSKLVIKHGKKWTDFKEPLDMAEADELQQEACWVGYKQVGMKKKGDRQVPNCVKEELVESKMQVQNLKTLSHRTAFRATIKKVLPSVVAYGSDSNPDFLTFVGSKSDLESLATMAKQYKVGPIRENLEEKFTKKDFDKNEDENDHSLNAIMLAKEFGTSQEIKDMEDIDKRHKQRGHINDPDYSKRNALVRKYYPRLK